MATRLATCKPSYFCVSDKPNTSDVDSGEDEVFPFLSAFFDFPRRGSMLGRGRINVFSPAAVGHIGWDRVIPSTYNALAYQPFHLFQVESSPSMSASRPSFSQRHPKHCAAELSVQRCFVTWTSRTSAYPPKTKIGPSRRTFPKSTTA